MTVKLSEKDRTVLAAAHLDAHASMAELARRTGLREHTVRRSIEWMIEHQVLIPATAIDFRVLGLNDFTFYFSRTGETKRSRDALLKFMIQTARVSWLAELGGEHQYGLSVAARTVHEMKQFLNDLTSRTGDKIYEKSFALMVRWTIFSACFDAKALKKRTTVTFGLPTAPFEPDETDRLILAALAQNPVPSLRQIARDTGRPLATLSSRVERLEKAGVIVGHFYRLWSAAFGYHSFRLIIFERGSSSEFRDALYSFCESHQYVRSLVETLGDWDFEVRVDVPDSRQLNAIVTELHESFHSSIRNIKTLTLIEVHKLSFYPLAAEEKLEAKGRSRS